MAKSTKAETKPKRAAAPKAESASAAPASGAAKAVEKAVASKTAAPAGASPASGTGSRGYPPPHPDAELTLEQAQVLYDKLLAERERVTRGMREHLSEAIAPSDSLTDEVDVAQRHTEQAYLIRFADKERKLLREIEHALEKFAEGEYGVCEGTSEPISPKRLELRPWTRYSVAYKEQLERERKQHARD